MSGGALAATHYLINSKKQINPKVLKQLKGNKGATGSADLLGRLGQPARRVRRVPPEARSPMRPSSSTAWATPH